MRARLLLSLVLVAAACTEPEPDCSVDVDCPEGERCADGTCVPLFDDGSCEADVDCSEGEICFNHVCVEYDPGPNPTTCPEPSLDEAPVCSDWDGRSCPCLAGEVSFREKELGGRLSCSGIVGIFDDREAITQVGCHIAAQSGRLEGELFGFEEAMLRIAQLPDPTACSAEPDRWTEGPDDPGGPAIRIACSATCQFWMVQHRAPLPERRVLDGTFELGTPAAVAAPGGDDELPAHEVELTCFSIDRYEVSRGNYEECQRAGACEPPELPTFGPGEARYYGQPNLDLPMTFVNHRQATQYCRYRGKELPTEAEWERAARSDEGSYASWPWGDASPFPSAGERDCARANFAGCGDSPRAVQAGEAGASGADVVGLAGNVREWTRDFYRADVYASRASLVPRNPEQTEPVDGGRARVVRGGSFRTTVDPLASLPTDALRVSDRDALDEASALEDLGFRCVRYKAGVLR